MIITFGHLYQISEQKYMKKLIALIPLFVLFGIQAGAQKKDRLNKKDTEFLLNQQDGIYAKIETNRGDIYLVLEHKLAPITVANFIGLAEGSMQNAVKPAGVPFYDGLKFHRVITNFMIQGGCPLGNGMGDAGYKFEDEVDPSSELVQKGYVRGTLAMANSGINTNGSQFFIMHRDNPMPPNYSIFGHVVRGMEVVDSIALTPRDGSDIPLTDQKILRVTILRKGKEAESFVAPKVFETERANIPIKAAAKAKAEDEVRALANAEAQKRFMAAKTTTSGLKYIVEKEGTGVSPKINDQVTVFYRGIFTNGKQFDGNIGGEPLTYLLGGFIKGWQEGLQLMKQGGKTTFYIPYNMAYGLMGNGSIPPKSDLIFEIELLKVN